MRSRGIFNAAQLSRESEVSQACIGKMLNLKINVFNKKGEPVNSVKKIANFFCVLPDQIFPEGHTKKLETNKFTTQLSSHDAMIAFDNNTSPEHYLELFSKSENDVFSLVDELLTKREAEIIRMRFDENLTYSEIGEKQGCSGTRVRQIEARGLRKLKHPSKSDKLLEVSGFDIDTKKEERHRAIVKKGVETVFMELYTFTD